MSQGESIWDKAELTRMEKVGLVCLLLPWMFLLFLLFFCVAVVHYSSYLGWFLGVLIPIGLIILMAIVSNLPKWPRRFLVPVLLVPVVMALPRTSQWLALGSAFSSTKTCYLNDGDRASLPYTGSYAVYDKAANSLTIRRSPESKEVNIKLGQNPAKAFGFSLFGDKLAVRFHYIGEWQSQAGIVVFYNTETGEKLGATSTEAGFMHGPLNLLW